MPNNKYKFDLARLKRIFTENQGTMANEKLRSYVETLFPLHKGASEKDKQRREESLALAFDAAIGNARRRGYVKSHHNRLLRFSRWSAKKKVFFLNECFAKGLNWTETVAQYSQFKDDFESMSNKAEAMHNIANAIGATAAHRSKRREVTNERRRQHSEMNRISEWWQVLAKKNPARYKVFETEFLKRFRTNCRLEGNTNRDILTEWPEAENEKALIRAARFLGEKRNRIEIAKEYQTEAQLEKAIRTQLEELVFAKELVTLGEDKLYEKLFSEFTEKISQSKYELPNEKFLPMLESVLWSEGADGSLTALDDIVGKNLWPKMRSTFLEHFPHIPARNADRKAEWLRGITNKLFGDKQIGTSTLPGVNRFIDLEGLEGGDDFEFSQASYSKPFKTQITGKNWSYIAINGANVGLEHDQRIEKNVVWQALNEAERRKVDAVIITNTIDINTKKAAGPSKVVEAFFSGIDINPNVLDPDYLERVKETIEKNPSDRVVHITKQEILKDIMQGWRKILLGPDDPVNPKKAVAAYSGPIYIVFGVREAQLTSAAAYWEIHRINLNQQTEVRTELGLEERAYKKMFALLKDLEIERIEAEAHVQAHPNDNDANTNLIKIETRMTQISKKASECQANIKVLNALKNRTIISFVSDPDLKRFHRKALAYFVNLFEGIGKKDESVVTPPNLKVVGMGDVCLQIGDQRVGINIPSHLRITDSLLADYNSTYGPKVIRQEMPNLAMIAHPYALNPRGGAREVDAKGIRGSAQVCVLPMCADDKFLRSKIRQIVEKTKHPVGRSVFKEQMATGVMLVTCHDGVISTNPILIGALDVRRIRKRSNGKSKVEIAGKYIWGEIDTDVHIGNRNREFLYLKEKGILRYGVSEAAFRMFREAKFMPLHFISFNDDLTHGDHFNQHRQPHHHEIPHNLIQEEMNRLYEEAEIAQNRRTKRELYEEAKLLALQQLSVRGIPWVTDQIESFCDEFLEPNIDIFSGILDNVERTKLRFRGVSELTPGVRSDRRDVGAISFGSGNHVTKSSFGQIAEGPLMRRNLKYMMYQFPRWFAKKNMLDKLIRAPLYGNIHVAYGTLQAPGGYEYGLDFRGTPPSSGTNWSDPLMMAVRIGQRRGNVSRIHEGRMTLITHGDKHFQAYVLTNYGIYIMAPPDTPTDSFAEWAGGFPPNNTGVVFVGLPAEGPESGPILIRPLLFDHIKRFFESKEKFDLEAYLPNAL